MKKTALITMLLAKIAPNFAELLLKRVKSYIVMV